MRTHLDAFTRVGAGLCIGLLVSCGGGGYGGGSSRPATGSISVDPTTITLGQSATITWSSTGTTCTASGAWSGPKAGSGTETVTPTATGMLTYTLLCAGGGYTESQALSTTLTVNAMSGFVPTALVSKFAGTAAPTTDSKLTNPRGIAFAPSAPVRVVNSATSTAYDGNGKQANDMTASTIGSTFDSTAIVANPTSDFIIRANGKFGPAAFIYAGKAGMISGVSSAVDRVNAVPMFTATDGAVYMGLAMANNGKGNFLFATDFHNNKIDVFDASFTRQLRSTESFAFSDPTLPAGYAPIGILAVENRTAAGATQIYVAYAKQLPPDARDSAIGAGLGLVNVFDTNGRLLRHLVPAGIALNAPWGMALAPADFGTFSRALLIGNSGDGKINAYDAVKGTFIGTLSDSDARPIVMRGLRGIAFGNDSNDQPHNALFFTAGTDEADGTYGRIDLH